MTIAIIGFGPRGLYSLECLIQHSIATNTLKSLKVFVFDYNTELGTGIAWTLTQSESNWINISNRALEKLKGRQAVEFLELKIPEFPSYRDWYIANISKQYNCNEDRYPPRAIMGQYLNQRALTLLSPLIANNTVLLINDRVEHVEWKQTKFQIRSRNSKIYSTDQCLLTIGHTSTAPTDEVIEHKNHASKNQYLYIDNPYEDDVTSKSFSGKNVFIMGLGLSMLDVLRMLTMDKGGTFSEKDSLLLEFSPSEKVPQSIIPYSFDGLPCVPKPLGAHIDRTFMPSEDVLHRFEKELHHQVKTNPKAFSVEHLAQYIAQIGKQLYKTNFPDFESSNLAELFTNWILDEDDNHEGFLDKAIPIRDYIIQTIEMACGVSQPSLDYFMGQLWRHLQPKMYRVFSFTELKGETIKTIIDIDERIKRYSYGPPVESMKQMLALIDAGILNTEFVSDPNIKRSDKGWELSKNESSIYSTVLINSVMDNPDLSKMDTPLTNALKTQNLVHEVYDELGIQTNAVAKAFNDKVDVPLYIIGRNAKGSILGADAILECFSPDIQAWAEHIINQI